MLFDLFIMRVRLGAIQKLRNGKIQHFLIPPFVTHFYCLPIVQNNRRNKSLDPLSRYVISAIMKKNILLNNITPTLYPVSTWSIKMAIIVEILKK